VRVEATRTLQALPGDYSAEAATLLNDSSEDVRIAAIDYLCTRQPEESLPRLRSLLEEEKDLRIRFAAARWVSRHPVSGFVPSAGLIRELMSVSPPDAVAGRSAAAALTAYLPAAEAFEIQRKLIDDPAPEVTAAAAAAGASSGNMKLVFNVVNMLGVATLRQGARDALLVYGERIIGTLGDFLSDSQGDLAIRREIPWVLCRIASKRSLEILLDNLETEDSDLKYRVVKALNRLHESNPELPIPHALIDERIHSEVRGYYDALSLSHVISPNGDRPAKALLAETLRSRLGRRLEVIFRLLGLRHTPKDIYFAYSAITGSHANRIAAIEFLDNVLDKRLKPSILPLLEESTADVLVERAKSLFGIQYSSRTDAVRTLLKQSDVWLKVCALHDVGENRNRELADDCRVLAGDRNALVQETAVWALRGVGTA
jgi:HEAT repeat protein